MVEDLQFPLLLSLNPEVSNVMGGYTLVSGPIRQLKCYSVSLAHTQLKNKHTDYIKLSWLN